MIIKFIPYRQNLPNSTMDITVHNLGKYSQLEVQSTMTRTYDNLQ
jgi:hypothetical protein